MIAQRKLSVRLYFDLFRLYTITTNVSEACGLYMIQKYGKYPCFMLWGCSIGDGGGRVVSHQLSYNIPQRTTAYRYGSALRVNFPSTAPRNFSPDMQRHVGAQSVPILSSRRGARNLCTPEIFQRKVCSVYTRSNGTSNYVIGTRACPPPLRVALKTSHASPCVALHLSSTAQ